MNFEVNLDWKFVVAFGFASAVAIFAVKMDADAAERVSIHAIDAWKERAFALTGER